MEGLVYDNLNWAKDKEILSIINKEILYYSNKVTKINHYGISQERYLVLTDEALYNFHKKKLKRKIKYDQIRGVTFSRQSLELVIHGNDDEYDYQYQSNERNLLLCFIARFYEEQIHQPLKISEVNDKSLKNYVTGKKEKKKGKNFSKMDETKLIDTKKFFEEKANSNKKARTSSIVILGEEEKINDEFPIQINSTIIFCKNNNFQNSCLEDFKILKILGRGAFGKVYLVQYKNTKEYYAMKSIKKEFLLDINSINSLIVEKKIILQNLNHKFLIGTQLCFHTNERIYFIMNLIQGESLVDYMKYNKNMKEEQVKFYAAIIGLILEYLHKNGIKYREIRPNDIIIDKDGYIKISDFKMSKLFILNNNFIIVKETSEYLSPELLKSNKFTMDSDWWAYGIILYELLFDVPPYFNENDEEIRKQIEKMN